MHTILEVCTASSAAHALVFARAQALNRTYADQLRISLLCSDGPEVALMRAHGMQVILCDLHRSLQPLQLVRSLINLAQVLRQQHYDVIHLHFGVPSLIGRLLAPFFRRSTWIYQSHGYSIGADTPYLQRSLYLLIERSLKYTVDLAFFQSHEDLKLARDYRLLSEKQMIYLGNGIDTERFRPQPSPSGGNQPTNRPTVFGMVARFEPIKNHALLLKAASQLKQQNRNFKILLIGQGHLKADIAAQIQQDGLEPYIEIHSYSHDMPSFYQHIDVGILTSFGEGLPRALLEPMACEKPVICTDVKGSREAVINQVTGFIVPIEHVEPLVQAMLWCIEHPAERQQLGKAARQQVLQHFSESSVITRLGQVYLACATRRKPTAFDCLPKPCGDYA